MTDDKPVLTRRRMLGGMATVGAAGALGAGTWAQYTDTETGQIKNLTGGTLDLTINGQNGNVAKVNPSEALSAGERYTAEFVLGNEGNTAGECISIVIPPDSVTSGEGENPEGEQDDEGQGELDDRLKIDVYLDDGQNRQEFYSGDFKGKAVGLESHLNETLAPGDEDTLVVDVLNPSKEGHDNRAMGDTLTFDIDVTLNQNPCSSQ